MDESEFFKEIGKLLKGNENDEIRNKLQEIFDLYKRREVLGLLEKDKANFLVDELLEYIFKAPYAGALIPMEFIKNSSVGRVFFELKFGVGEKEYNTAEIGAIMSVSRAYISAEASRAEIAKSEIKINKKDRFTYMYERDIINFMRSKGIDDEIINARIRMFKELKQKGLETKEIKKRIQDIFKK